MPTPPARFDAYVARLQAKAWLTHPNRLKLREHLTGPDGRQLPGDPRIKLVEAIIESQWCSPQRYAQARLGLKYPEVFGRWLSGLRRISFEAAAQIKADFPDVDCVWPEIQLPKVEKTASPEEHARLSEEAKIYNEYARKQHGGVVTVPLAKPSKKPRKK